MFRSIESTAKCTQNKSGTTPKEVKYSCGVVNHGRAARLPKKSGVTENPYQHVVSTPAVSAPAPMYATTERNLELPANVLSGKTTAAAAICQ